MRVVVLSVFLSLSQACAIEIPPPPVAPELPEEPGPEEPEPAPVPDVVIRCDDMDGDERGVGPDCLGEDCRDDDPFVYEGAEELCNGLDDDCDGVEDEGVQPSGEACDTGEQGLCGPGLLSRCEGGEPVCVRSQDPEAEICNGEDEDCDGVADNGCPTLLETDEDRDLTDFGGGGGDPFRLVCEAGQVAVGVDLRSDDELESIQVICQTIALNEKRDDTPFTYLSAADGEQSLTEPVGGEDGIAGNMTCPEGSFLHMARVRSGDRVDQLELACAQAGYVGYPHSGEVQISDTLLETFGGDGGNLRDETRCEEGEFIAGFHGRAGNSVVRIGVVCRAINVSVR